MGKVISERYEELEQLGHGGQGVVYKVRHIKHKTVLALKALPSYFLANPMTVGRLEQEALVLTRLRHRNIVQVVGSGRDETLGMIYIVMEYIEGKTLKEYIQEKGSLPLSDVLEITRQVGNALAYAHGRTPPVIHRDIKPSNIIIEDLSGRVVLLDFGIAKEMSESTESHTRTGYMVGTWKYSSPEQLRHEPLTGSADIYSLGMVMYEMYTGIPFFPGRDEPSILGKILHDPQEYELSFPLPPISEFAAIIQKAIAKSRDTRYANMSDFLDDVDACWSLVDETRILGISDSIVRRPPPFQDPGDGERTAIQHFDLDRTAITSQQDDRDIETIDAEIRKLQEERQQRFVLSLQARVKEAREKAEQAGAKQWAEAQFEQGATQEEQANALFLTLQYATAQGIFETALTSFTQAYEETVRAKLRSRAEQARREVEVAKGDADRQGAPEHAHEAYTHAQELVTEAETQFKQEVYEAALKRYVDARNSFEDARDLAYREKRREEADAARLEASTAREAALGEGAETFAISIVEEARRNEQQATAALEREEFTQARVLYLAASQKYEHAQRRAHSEHLQREVARAAQSAQEAQQRVLACQEPADTQPVYRQALETQKRAAALRDAREYEKATQEFENARRGYEEVATAFLTALHQRAEDAQQRTLSARSQAEQEQVQEKALDVYQRAVALQQHADERMAEGAYQDAMQGYENARLAFVEAHEYVTTQLLQDQAARAQEQMQQAQKAAHEAHADVLAAEAFTQGQETEREANAALAQADFLSAQRLYETAQQYYMRAEDRARVERRQQWQRAMQSAQQTLAVQDRVRAADPDIESHPHYRQTDELYQRAQAHLAAEEYDQAEHLYHQVQVQYEALLQKVADERATQSMAEARQRQERAQEAAEHAGVRQRFAARWEQASNRVSTAQQHEQRGEHAEAEACYRDAEQQFASLAEEATQQAAREEEERRQRVHTRKQQTTRSRTDAEEAEAHRYVQEVYRQALQDEREGDEAFVAAQWEKAERAFANAQEQFATALAGARRRKEASDKAEQAKQRALLIRDDVPMAQATALFPERVAEGQALEATADQALRRADFSGAQRGFAQAADVFLQLQRDVNAHVAQENASDEPTRIASLAGTGNASDSRMPVAVAELLSPASIQPLQKNAGEREEKTEDATVIMRSLPTPVEAENPLMPPEVGASASQTSVHLTSRHQIVPERPIQKYVAIGAGLLAVLAGLFMAQLGNREKPVAPQQVTTDSSPAKLDEQDRSGTLTPSGQKTPTPAEKLAPPSPPPPVTPVETPPTTTSLPKLVNLRPAAEKEVIIKEGSKQMFTVAINPAGSKSLRYEWYVDANKQAATTENRWTYAPGYDEGSETTKTITVVLRDGDQELDRQSWANVVVKHQPQAPKITTLSPEPGKPIQAAFGAELSFSIAVHDPDSVAGQPTWFLDGKEIGQGISQKVRIPAEGATHIVTVSFADGVGGKVTAPEWNVVIPAALQPNLVDVRPKGDTITTQVGRMVEFSAIAELPVRLDSGAKPQLEWRVDGTIRQTKETRQFRFVEEREGSYVVTVVGINRDGGRSAPKQWTVSVQPPPIGRVGGELTKDDVRDWIERYRRAIEQKDGKMLEQLGLDKTEARERIDDVKRHDDLVIKTEIQEQDIQLEGQPAKRAKISFTRRDIRDGIQTAPGLVRYTLEKQSSGRVVVGR